MKISWFSIVEWSRCAMLWPDRVTTGGNLLLVQWRLVHLILKSHHHWEEMEPAALFWNCALLRAVCVVLESQPVVSTAHLFGMRSPVRTSVHRGNCPTMSRQTCMLLPVRYPERFISLSLQQSHKSSNKRTHITAQSFAKMFDLSRARDDH